MVCDDQHYDEDPQVGERGIEGLVLLSNLHDFHSARFVKADVPERASCLVTPRGSRV